MDGHSRYLCMCYQNKHHQPNGWCLNNGRFEVWCKQHRQLPIETSDTVDPFLCVPLPHFCLFFNPAADFFVSLSLFVIVLLDNA